jgi:hypothetical protein
MDDWTLQSVLILIGGLAVTIGLWAAFIWTLSKDDPRK